jgi:hypothetical protein
MCCILCHKKAIIATNPKKQARKLFFYYKTNGITFFKKHVDVVHMFIAKEFEKEMNNSVKQTKEIHLAKKKEI